MRTIVRAVLLLSGQSKQHVVAATLEAGIEQVRGVARAETPSAAEMREGVARLYDALGLPMVTHASAVGEDARAP